MVKNKAELIFEKWKTELSTLPSSERKNNMVEANFDRLFSALHRAKISFDDAYAYIDKATKSHYPSRDAEKYTYKMLKSKIPQTEAEFVEKWRLDIQTKCKSIFYSLYPIDGEAEKEEQFGSMSSVEYRKQRAYADSFPKVDLEKIRRERKKLMDDILESTNLGAKDE
jgi:hypothetical protein